MWNIFGWADEIDEATITLVQTMMYTTGGILDYLPHVISRWQLTLVAFLKKECTQFQYTSCPSLSLPDCLSSAYGFPPGSSEASQRVAGVLACINQRYLES